jgi:hypothetical protein
MSQREELELRVHGLLADVWRYMDHVLDELKVSRAKEWPSVVVEASDDGAHWAVLWEGVRTVGSEVTTTLRVPPGATWLRVKQSPASATSKRCTCGSDGYAHRGDCGLFTAPLEVSTLKLEPWTAAPLHDDALGTKSSQRLQQCRACKWVHAMGPETISWAECRCGSKGPFVDVWVVELEKRWGAR